MKKILLVLCAFISIGAQAQKLKDTGHFTLNVKLGDKETKAVSYQIYQNDNDYRISKKPVATIPVQNAAFTYETELNSLKGIRLKGVGADGTEVGRPVDLFLVPGAELSVELNDGEVTRLDKDTSNYVSRLRRYVWDVRRGRNWTTSRLPKPTGKHWAEVKQNCSDFDRMWVKEVWMSKKETVVRLVTEPSEYRRGASSNDYLVDDKGRTYRMLRPILGTPDQDFTIETALMGCYYAFEPLPDDVTSFSYVSEGCKISDIRESTDWKHEPNFTVTIKPTNGINDSGYLIFRADDKSNNSVVYYTQMLADVECDENGEATFKMYIDEPTKLFFLATFPGGNVCTAGILRLAFPDSHLKVSVMNGTFDFSGTGVYQQIQDFQDFYYNVRAENITTRDADDKVRLYFMDHADEYGVLYLCANSDFLPIEKVYSYLNSAQLSTPMGRIIKEKYDAWKHEQDERERKQEEERRLAQEKRDAIKKDIAHRRELGDKEADEPFDRADFPVGNAVDLGLSVKWADMNVGAKAPEQGGYYYAWGEISPVPDKPVEWATYKWCEGSSQKLTKYCTKAEFGKVDNLITLQPCDDVAHVRWGGNWRMPTADELQELCDKCTWEWVVLNGKPGSRVTGPNGNSIFLPANGMYNHLGLDTSLQGVKGYIWASEINPDNPVMTTYFVHRNGACEVRRGTTERRPGIAVRPVCGK